MNSYDQMREALKYIVSLLRSDTFVVLNLPAVEIIAKIFLESEAALALPRRNCDVGTAEEHVRRHCSMCVAITKNGTKGCDYSKCNSCFAKWAQMPYEAEEGGAK